MGMGLLGMVFVLAMGKELRMDVHGIGRLAFQWRLAEGAQDAMELRVNGRLVEAQEETGVWRTCSIYLLDDDEFHLSWHARTRGEVRLLKSVTSDFPVECPREIPASGGVVQIRVHGEGEAHLRPLEETAPFCVVNRVGTATFRCAVAENPEFQKRILRFSATLEDAELNVIVERVIEIHQEGALPFSEKN